MPGRCRGRWRRLGIREQAGRPTLELLLEVLRGQNVLIVLDNCEHVVDTCAKLADLVERGCPRVYLLVTSREPLGIDGERVYRLRPLSLPPQDAASAGDLAGSDAVELFAERARSHDSGFVLEDSTAGLVASICRRLDGVPFAIELAAARLSAMSLVDLNERLDQRFRLLTGGSRTAVARQRTLQATVEWSFDLLNEPERAVLRRLSVFVGGFDLDAAEVTGATEAVETSGIADLLASLVNKSLIVAEPSSGSLRYRLLETIRQYAADQLVRSGGEAEAARARSAHAEYYLQLAETAAAELTGPRQGRWLKRLDLEWDNLRAALAYLSAEPGRTTDVLRLGVALFRFLISRGLLDPVAQLRAAPDRADPVPPGLRARALYVASYLVIVQALQSRRELGTVRELAGRALEMARDLGDRELAALALGVLCVEASLREEPGPAALLGEEALEVARSTGDPRLIGEAVFCLAWVPASADRRRELELEALASFRQAGDTLYIAAQLGNLGALESEDGNLETARRHYEEAIAAAEEIGAVWVLANQWSGLGIVLLLQGELTEAAALARQSLITGRRLGLGREVAAAIFVLACCATGAADYRRAAQLTGAHDVIDAAVIDAGANYSWTPLEQAARDRNRARLRQALGEGEFDRAYHAGRALGLDQAADLALGRTLQPGK
jgi:predicted ATPase